MKCPKCGLEIYNEDINIKTDVGRCWNCEALFHISDILKSENLDDFDLDKPPKGTWIKKDFDCIKIGASTRSILAIFFFPFVTVWSSMAIGGLYLSQIFNGHFSLLLSLFGIPFIFGSILFWYRTLLMMAGKVELTLDKFGGKVFIGFGKIGFTDKFTWDEIKSVKDDFNISGVGNLDGDIIIDGKERISFGRGLKIERRYYLFCALKTIFKKVKSKQSFL